MIVEQIRTGGDRNFAYIVADETTRTAAVIDPSYTPEKVYQRVRERELELRYVLNTHGHHDHTNGNRELERLSGRRALLHGDRDPDSGIRIEHGARLPLGELAIRVIHTPGHSHDSVCYLAGDALFSGDTLFIGKVGGTDYGREAEMQFHSLREKLLALPDATRVFPGHDVGVQPSSTIGREKETNPFLLRSDYDDFLELKKNWLEYKRVHGID